ncbi:MAG: hypothetical protein HYW08_14095 [candidate division NC10 bacterium]|nr:hypothetical protein [candidate division NC10 bacterium]
MFARARVSSRSSGSLRVFSPRVPCSRKTGRARIEVLDTGPGIPPDVLPRIFNAFTTTKPRGQGTGLGLWISHALIERHDGSLRAENRPEGGAAFRVK